MIKKRFSLIPLYSFKNITDISVSFLQEQGIRFLMLDLDNTIAAYDEHVFSDDISKWIKKVQDSGITIFIISNSTRNKRVTSHSESIGADFIMQSGKPSPKSLHAAMEKAGFSENESALAGDQIMTDTLAANHAGIISIIVKPKKFTNPFFALRYYIEQPFRALCKNKF